MTKIQVPEGMLKATANCLIAGSYTESLKIRTAVLEAALQWLSEHPIVPTDEQIESLLYGMQGLENFGRVALKRGAVEWQRRMFLAEPEIPESALDPRKCPHRWQVKDDLTTAEKVIYCELCEWVYSRTAFELCRGQRSKG